MFAVKFVFHFSGILVPVLPFLLLENNENNDDDGALSTQAFKKTSVQHCKQMFLLSQGNGIVFGMEEERLLMAEQRRRFECFVVILYSGEEK